MDRIVIYTCIVGAYDELLQPLVVEEGMDYICFVGKGELHPEKDGVWTVRELPFSLGDSTLDARYPKMHPHELLPEYDCSVWIDANVLVKDGTLGRCARIKAAAGVKYSGVPHPSRDCVYEEAKKCRDMKYISWGKLFRIWAFLFLHRFPRHAGLMENNLIFRRHNDQDIIAFDEFWWSMVVDFCRRDQISHGYCMRKFGIRADWLLGRGQNTRNNPGFEYRLHKKKQCLK